MTSEQTAINLIRTRTNEELLNIWEETEKQITTAELYMVRGWLLDIMKERDPHGFDKWMDNEDITIDNPRQFLFN